MELSQVQEKFIMEWGSLGSAWGINRTMAQINALLLISPEPLSTDEVMETLKVSRGNAHTNLKELINWGIIRSVTKPGDRKEYFQSEKDPWQLFCIVSGERKRREIDPLIRILDECIDESKSNKDKASKEFRKELTDLKDFAETASGILEKISRSKNNNIMKKIINFFA